MKKEEGLGENHVGLVALAVFYVPVTQKLYWLFKNKFKMRAPCTVWASIVQVTSWCWDAGIESILTSQHQDVTCNPGAPSRSGQYLLLRHVHTPDWQTIGLQQKHAALPGFVFPCFFYLYFHIFFFPIIFLCVFQNIFVQGQLRPFHKALPCCRCLLAVPGLFFFLGEKSSYFKVYLFLRT